MPEGDVIDGDRRAHDRPPRQDPTGLPPMSLRPGRDQHAPAAALRASPGAGRSDGRGGRPRRIVPHEPAPRAGPARDAARRATAPPRWPRSVGTGPRRHGSAASPRGWSTTGRGAADRAAGQPPGPPAVDHRVLAPAAAALLTSVPRSRNASRSRTTVGDAPRSPRKRAPTLTDATPPTTSPSPPCSRRVPLTGSRPTADRRTVPPGRGAADPPGLVRWPRSPASGAAARRPAAARRAHRIARPARAPSVRARGRRSATRSPRSSLARSRCWSSRTRDATPPTATDPTSTSPATPASSSSGTAARSWPTRSARADHRGPGHRADRRRRARRPRGRRRPATACPAGTRAAARRSSDGTSRSAPGASVATEGVDRARAPAAHRCRMGAGRRAGAGTTTVTTRFMDRPGAVAVVLDHPVGSEAGQGLAMTLGGARRGRPGRTAAACRRAVITGAVAQRRRLPDRAGDADRHAGPVTVTVASEDGWHLVGVIAGSDVAAVAAVVRCAVVDDAVRPTTAGTGAVRLRWNGDVPDRPSARARDLGPAVMRLQRIRRRPRSRRALMVAARLLRAAPRGAAAAAGRPLHAARRDRGHAARTRPRRSTARSPSRRRGSPCRRTRSSRRSRPRTVEGAYRATLPADRAEAADAAVGAQGRSPTSRSRGSRSSSSPRARGRCRTESPGRAVRHGLVEVPQPDDRDVATSVYLSVTQTIVKRRVPARRTSSCSRTCARSTSPTAS